MKLHTDSKFFADTIMAASQNLKIREEFIEKDYWITLLLSRLSVSKYGDVTVFKGGTSLSKGFRLINRFSEDVDLAIVDTGNKSGNEIKTIIRAIEKIITQELTEVKVEGLTSKGSRFRKSVHEYISLDTKNKNNKVILEVNSFANPFPYQTQLIQSMVYDFLAKTQNDKYIEKYSLQPFHINVLNKDQTLVEKLVSLIRFSFDDNPDVNLKVSTPSGVCIIGQSSECLVSESTRKPGQIYDVVEVDGMNLNVRYSGSDVRLEKFSILPESSSEFLPDVNWNLEVIKDEQVSRLYYKVTYKSLE